MKIVRCQDVPREPVLVAGACGTTVRWLIAKGDGAPNFAMRLFELAPGGATPLHTHPAEHEVFILAGTGAVWREEEEVPIEAGTAIFVPPGEKHCFKNRGADPLRFLCVVPITD
jgi:quercetin dioxygenase-like cupin family protein